MSKKNAAHHVMTLFTPLPLQNVSGTDDMQPQFSSSCLHFRRPIKVRRTIKIVPEEHEDVNEAKQFAQSSR